MELNFERIDNLYVAELEVTSDFNLHIERDTEGRLDIYQRTAGGQYEYINDIGWLNRRLVYDYDFTALVYPKYIKIVTSVLPLVATITTDGEVNELKYQEKSVEITSNGTTKVTADAGYNGLAQVKVKVNVEGGSGGGSTDEGELKRNDVNFFDYDGTLLYSYSWDEAKELTELPPLPVHDGLEVREWNYTLEDIKEQGMEATIGKADVGACVYDDYGEQVVGNGVLIYERGVTSIKYTSYSVIGVLSIPVTIKRLGHENIGNVLFTSEVKIPASVSVAVGSYPAFYNTHVPSVYWNGANKEYVDGTSPLNVVVISENVRVIYFLPENCIVKFHNIDEIWYGGNNGGQKTLLDFTNVDYVPYIDVGWIINTYSLYVIVVPDSLYEEWINTTNWSDIADYIYPLSSFPWMNNK